jgi:peptidoglycan/LPS O-acetylase OafA/YrhL
LTRTSGRSEILLQTNPQIRRDIEGLRAIAVLSVLLYHACPKILPGGYSGVDIFFVISGYLIGKHLLEDIQAARFSILGFYASRARRIFPALALILISVWCAGWFFFTTAEFAELGRQILASALFSNNILLSLESGYFDTSALEKPLLHLWSLGIEEQFYLLVPAMLWLASKEAMPSIRWVARLGAVSFIAAVSLNDFDYVSSFYLLHTRFWELAAGVALAQAELRLGAQPHQHYGKHRAPKAEVLEIQIFCALIVFVSIVALASSGLEWREEFFRGGGLFLAIAASVATACAADRYGRVAAESRQGFWFTCRPGARLRAMGSLAAGVILIVALTSQAQAGVQTIFPVLGTALVIASGPKELFNRLLGCRPLVFVGGLSYPLYLWHWPAIVFFRMLSPGSSATGMAIPLGISFALAWLTKNFLEDPVRFGRMGAAMFQRPHLAPVMLGLMFAGVLGLSAAATDGVPSRLSARTRDVGQWSESEAKLYIKWRAGRCYRDLHDSTDFSAECAPAKRPGTPLILVWGDSHAADLYPGMADLRSASTFDIAQWTAAACPPTVVSAIKEDRSCVALRAASIGKLARLNPDTIVMAGAWERYVENGAAPDQLMAAVSDTIRLLHKAGVRRIVVFGPGPLWATSLPVDLFRFMARNESAEIPERLGRPTDAMWKLDASFAALAAREHAEYVSVLNTFCNKEGCLTVGDKTLPRPDLLFYDRDHLTVSGSKFLITHSKPQLLGVTPVPAAP